MHAFKRQLPQLWDVMQRCFRLYDVKSQSQYSVNQRREEMMNEGTNNNLSHTYSETYGGEILDSQVPETQENEEVYHINIDDERRPSNEFIHEYTRYSSPSINLIQIPVSRVQQRGRGRRGSTSQISGVNSRGTIGSGSRGSRRKQYFETTLTDTMTGFREFQCQSLQQLHPNSFDQNDFDECETVVKIFEAMELPNDTKFYWECIRAFKEGELWRKYFIARADKSFEDIHAMINV